MRDGCYSKSWGLRFNLFWPNLHSVLEKSLNNNSCPCPEVVCEDMSLLWKSPWVQGGSCPQGHRATHTCSRGKLLPAASGISPSPSPDVLHEVQDSRAALGLCLLKARRMKVCAEDMRHFWLSSGTIMTYRYAQRLKFGCVCFEGNFFFQAYCFSRLDLGLHF